MPRVFDEAFIKKGMPLHQVIAQLQTIQKGATEGGYENPVVVEIVPVADKGYRVPILLSQTEDVDAAS